jgi:HD-GYP domain-containing protein (c-di-GMP phosphodiesterase class II)
MQDSSSMALSLQRSMLEQLASRSMMDPSLGATSSNANAVAARALSDQRLPYGLPSQMLLDDRQSRLLQAIRQQQQLADLESTSEESSGRSSLQHHHQQQPTSISNAISDFQRIRETLLIDQYRRERAIADAQQRMIWNQLSEQARARYEASFLAPSADAINNNSHHHHPDESLRQMIELQRLQNLHGLDRLVSSSETGLRASAIPPDSLIRLAMTQNHFDQPVERSTEHSAAPSDMKSSSTSPERKSSVSSEEERISAGLGKASRRSPSSPSRSTSQPPTKKAKTTSLAKQQQKEGSDA